MDKKSWDDIPSLDGVGVDWEFKPESSLGKRASARLDEKRLARMLENSSVLVKVATREAVHDGRLHDLSEGGLAVDLEVRLLNGQPVRVGFLLNQKKIISTAQVRHLSDLGGGRFRVGVQFVGLEPATRKYLADLYAAQILKQAP